MTPQNHFNDVSKILEIQRQEELEQIELRQEEENDVEIAAEAERVAKEAEEAERIAEEQLKAQKAQEKKDSDDWVKRSRCHTSTFISVTFMSFFRESTCSSMWDKYFAAEASLALLGE